MGILFQKCATYGRCPDCNIQFALKTKFGVHMQSFYNEKCNNCEKPLILLDHEEIFYKMRLFGFQFPQNSLPFKILIAWPNLIIGIICFFFFIGYLVEFGGEIQGAFGYAYRTIYLTPFYRWFGNSWFKWIGEGLFFLTCYYILYMVGHFWFRYEEQNHRKNMEENR